MTSVEQSIINSYNSIKNVFKMLKNRGFIINDKDDFKHLLGDVVDFKLLYSDDMNFKFEKEDKTEIYCQILKNIKKKKNLQEKLLEILDENDIHNIIFIGYDLPISYQYELEDKYKKNIELFSFTELNIDVISHILVPKHILLSEDEKNKLLTLYKEDDLPKIKINDRIARYYNAKNGDIFKIIRNNMMGRNRTSGSGIYYRKVVL